MTQEILTKSTDLEKIQSGLKAFDDRKEELELLALSAKNLDVEDYEDKQALKAVSEKRKELKSARVKIQNEGKAMRDLIRPITKYISESENELIAIIQPEEERLQSREDWVKDTLDKIEQDRIEAENKKIQDRIDALAQYGFQIDYSDIKSMSDETFDKYLEAAKSQYEKDQAEKAEQERIRLEQEEKERIEREAEKKRIEEERAELEKLRKEQAQREAEIKAEQKAIEQEKLRIENEKRIEEEAKKRTEELRIAQEKAAEEAKLKAIADAKEAERLKNERAEKEKLAAERKAARQPDKIKIQEYIKSVKAIPVPEMKTQDGKDTMSSIRELISRFDDYATKKANEL